jgi:hypothetical protein
VTRVDPQLRAAAVDRLVAARDAGGLTSADVQRTAEGLGADERTVWRWLADAAAGRPVRRRYQLTEQDIAALYDWRGNVAAARRALVKAGAVGLPSLATLQRAFVEQLTPAARAAERFCHPLHLSTHRPLVGADAEVDTVGGLGNGAYDAGQPLLVARPPERTRLGQRAAEPFRHQLRREQRGQPTQALSGHDRLGRVGGDRTDLTCPTKHVDSPGSTSPAMNVHDGFPSWRRPASTPRVGAENPVTSCRTSADGGHTIMKTRVLTWGDAK